MGVIGKIAWYIPTYMLESNPELATWEGLRVPDTAKLFASAQTGEKGNLLQVIRVLFNMMNKLLKI